jgi:hypothetical protein
LCFVDGKRKSRPGWKSQACEFHWCFVFRGEGIPRMMVMSSVNDLAVIFGCMTYSPSFVTSSCVLLLIPLFVDITLKNDELTHFECDDVLWKATVA